MQKINTRLEAIAQRLALDPAGQALLALGSAGVEITRADKYSDIDFFAIVSPGSKTRFLEDVAWLEADSKVAWIFQNTPDGFKLLWEDGIFGEMAVFEPAELPEIAFSPGRVVWSQAEFPIDLLIPQSTHGVRAEPRDWEFLSSEMLTNIYVGLGRFLRGEKLSGWRFIQSHAFSLGLEIIELTQPSNPNVDVDRYNIDRRFEQRYETQREYLENSLLGISRTVDSAEYLLKWLYEKGLNRNPLTAEVEKLVKEARDI